MNATQWRRMAAPLLLLLLLSLVVSAVCVSAHQKHDSFGISLPSWAVELNSAHDVVPPPATASLSSPLDESLLAWADREDSIAFTHQARETTSTADVFLVVGAKTSVVHGFARRQAIRQTWANATVVPHGVRVLFLGCEPDFPIYPSARQHTLRDAIAREKDTYGDLLTSELSGCHDSFAGLSDKVKAFLHYAATSFPSLAFAMIADDDIYLRLDRLHELLQDPSTPTTRFFGGNSATKHYRGLTTAVRDPRNKYYLSPAAYPMQELPPFVAGAHFVLSVDLVRFVSRNMGDLQSIEKLDDVTVGLWLFALLRIRVTYLDQLHILRNAQSCADDFISLADLTVAATRHIHANILAGRPPCERFDKLQWTKMARGIVVPRATGSDDAMLARDDDRLSVFHWDLQYDETAQRLQIAVQVTVGVVAINFTYVPSTALAEEAFCGQAASLLQTKLYLVIGYEVCAYYCDVLLTALHQTTHDNPPLGPIVAIARHNVRQLKLHDELDQAAIADATRTNTVFYPSERTSFTVLLSRAAQSSRALVECLLVELLPDRQVLVLTEDDDDDVDRSKRLVSVDAYFTVASADESSTERRARGQATVVVEMVDTVPLSLSVEFADTHAVTLTSRPHDPIKTLYVPAVSRVFARTLQFTPAQLLRPSAEHDRDASSLPTRRGLRVLSDSFQMRVPSTEISRFVHELAETLSVDEVQWSHVGVHETARTDSVDDVVAALRGAAFVGIVTTGLEAHDGSDHVAVAFLAGAIPVLLGCATTGTIARLFNPRALIDCCGSAGEHTSRECVDRVLAVDASPSLYEQMRREPPITDQRVFQEAFAWHPRSWRPWQLRVRTPRAP